MLQQKHWKQQMMYHFLKLKFFKKVPLRIVTNLREATTGSKLSYWASLGNHSRRKTMLITKFFFYLPCGHTYFKNQLINLELGFLLLLDIVFNLISHNFSGAGVYWLFPFSWHHCCHGNERFTVFSIDLLRPVSWQVSGFICRFKICNARLTCTFSKKKYIYKIFMVKNEYHLKIWKAL